MFWFEFSWTFLNDANKQACTVERKDALENAKCSSISGLRGPARHFKGSSDAFNLFKGPPGTFLLKFPRGIVIL